MTQFQSLEDGVEVRGEAVLAFVNGMRGFKKKALDILQENGIANPENGNWYSQQAWLNAFKKIAEDVGPYTLYCIGARIPEDAQFPSGIDSLEAALASINTAYYMNHRGGKIGNYTFQKSLDGSFSFTCDNPYPCEFDRGIIEGIGRRFIPEGSHLTCKHDNSAPCRDKGAASCTYRLEIT
ncbi:MAG: hypothetical protein OEV89_00850 [Desulfobulbaceae bacterium]|nr:hypothetical protein [Desulfobulbaceae bacterium]HIJ89391.1 hypothetical protein [Deltaproteobacteria bacterium]